jgi:hypothetical protein
LCHGVLLPNDFSIMYKQAEEEDAISFHRRVMLMKG